MTNPCRGEVWLADCPKLGTLEAAQLQHLDAGLMRWLGLSSISRRTQQATTEYRPCCTVPRDPRASLRPDPSEVQI